MSIPADAFDEFLHFDPMLGAETLTGKSYKEDEVTRGLGFALMQRHASEKEFELGVRGDSYFNISWDGYLQIVEDLGFELLMQEELPGYPDPDTQSEFRIYWRGGILLACDSYRPEHLNSSSMYFNLEFPSAEAAFSISMSGHLQRQLYDGPKRFVWVGNVDAREGIRHTLGQIEDRATIMESWVERPLFWLANSLERQMGVDTDFVTEAKLAGLPEAVRSATKGIYPDRFAR